MTKTELPTLQQGLRAKFVFWHCQKFNKKTGSLVIGTKSNPEKILFTLKLWIFDVYIANFYNSVMHTSVFKGPFDP